MNSWPKQSECLAKFGNPSTPGWSAKNLVDVPVPFNMHMDSLQIHSVRCNKIAAESLTRVLTSIWNSCGHDQARVGACGCDVYSGCWNIRSIRGSTRPSMHSYALAIDINAPKNPLGWKEPQTLFKHDSLVVQAFRAENWTWGGDWTGRRDAMHFQAAIVG